MAATTPDEIAVKALRKARANIVQRRDKLNNKIADLDAAIAVYESDIEDSNVDPED